MEQNTYRNVKPKFALIQINLVVEILIYIYIL